MSTINSSKYLQLIIPEKNVKLLMPNGNVRVNNTESNNVIQIGCKVFDINTVSDRNLKFI